MYVFVFQLEDLDGVLARAVVRPGDHQNDINACTDTNSSPEVQIKVVQTGTSTRLREMVLPKLYYTQGVAHLHDSRPHMMHTRQGETQDESHAGL